MLAFGRNCEVEASASATVLAIGSCCGTSVVLFDMPPEEGGSVPQGPRHITGQLKDTREAAAGRPAILAYHIPTNTE